MLLFKLTIWFVYSNLSKHAYISRGVPCHRNEPWPGRFRCRFILFGIHERLYTHFTHILENIWRWSVCHHKFVLTNDGPVLSTCLYEFALFSKHSMYLSYRKKQRHFCLEDGTILLSKIPLICNGVTVISSHFQQTFLNIFRHSSETV